MLRVQEMLQIFGYLLLHCEIARAVWNDIFSRMDLAWVMLAIMGALLASWAPIGGPSQIQAMWKMFPICILWCIRRERNLHTFKDREHLLEELRSVYISTLFSWAVAIDFNGLSTHDFLVYFSSY